MRSLYSIKEEILITEYNSIVVSDVPNLHRLKEIEVNLAFRLDLQEFVVPVQVKASPLLPKQFQEIKSDYSFDSTLSVNDNAILSGKAFKKLCQYCKNNFLPDTFKLDVCGGRVFVYSQQFDVSI